MKKLCFLFFLFLLCSLNGEVFTLWPWQGSPENSSGANLSALPGIADKVLLREPIVINGVQMELEVTRSTAGMSAIVEYLTRLLKPENLELSGNTLKVTFPAGAGYLERWLLIDSGLGKPVTIFRLRSPEKMPVANSWPAALPPLPAGAKIEQVIRFPNRNGWYGSFSNAGESAEQLLRTTAAGLTAEGWIPAANEADPTVRGTGEIFIRNRPRSILWVVFGRFGIGSFYTRER